MQFLIAHSSRTHSFKWRSFRGKISFLEHFTATVARQPNDLAYIYEGRETTWKQAEEGE